MIASLFFQNFQSKIEMHGIPVVTFRRDGLKEIGHRYNPGSQRDIFAF